LHVDVVTSVAHPGAIMQAWLVCLDAQSVVTRQRGVLQAHPRMAPHLLSSTKELHTGATPSQCLSGPPLDPASPEEEEEPPPDVPELDPFVLLLLLPPPLLPLLPLGSLVVLPLPSLELRGSRSSNSAPTSVLHPAAIKPARKSAASAPTRTTGGGVASFGKSAMQLSD
jgi:hypothetical protein